MKRIIPLALILTLCLSLCANASVQTLNDFTRHGEVTVSGTTATCQLYVNARAAGTNASISADIELEAKVGTTYTQIASWSVSSTRTLNFSDSCTDSRISSGNCRMHYTITVIGNNGTDTVGGYVYG